MKYLLLFLLVSSCQEQIKTAHSPSPGDVACENYENDVLENALVNTDSEETMYAFVSDEKVAIKFLDAYTHKFYRYDEINSLSKKIAESCRQEDITKMMDRDPRFPCNSIINEYPFFQAFFWTAHKEKWSKKTIELGVSKARSLITFYTSKPSSLIETGTVAFVLRDMAKYNLISKDILKDLTPMINEREEYMEGSRKTALSQLGTPLTCENQKIGADFIEAEKFRTQLKTLLSEYSIL